MCSPSGSNGVDRPRACGRPVTDDRVVVRGVGKSYGDVPALRDISFTVAAGEVVGLLGPNGAGKSTTVDILSTLTLPDVGEARVAGHDVVADPGKVRESIMVTGQQVAVDDMLTGRQNLVMFGRLLGLTRRGAATICRAAARTGPRGGRGQAGQHLLGRNAAPRGPRVRADHRADVAFWTNPPPVWIPVAGRHLGLGRRIQDAGIATLLTTQYLEEADALCDRIVLIDGAPSSPRAPPTNSNSAPEATRS